MFDKKWTLTWIITIFEVLVILEWWLSREEDNVDGITSKLKCIPWLYWNCIPLLFCFSVYMKNARQEGDEVVLVHVSEYTALVQARKHCLRRIHGVKCMHVSPNVHGFFLQVMGWLLLHCVGNLYKFRTSVYVTLLSWFGRTKPVGDNIWKDAKFFRKYPDLPPFPFRWSLSAFCQTPAAPPCGLVVFILQQVFFHVQLWYVAAFL